MHFFNGYYAPSIVAIKKDIIYAPFNLSFSLKVFKKITEDVPNCKLPFHKCGDEFKSLKGLLPFRDFD